MSRRSDSGHRGPSDRRRVAVTVPQRVRDGAKQAAVLLDWSVGDWILAMAAEHGPQLTEALQGRAVTRRRADDGVTVVAWLYLTSDERDELDEVAARVGLTRSAFVTAVAQLGLGEDLPAVADALVATTGAARDPA